MSFDIDEMAQFYSMSDSQYFLCGNSFSRKCCGEKKKPTIDMTAIDIEFPKYEKLKFSKLFPLESIFH